MEIHYCRSVKNASRNLYSSGAQGAPASNNDTINSLPMVVGQNNSILPIVVEPIEAKNVIDLPIVVEPIQGKNYRSAHCGRAH